jgi:hypothetical protein
VRIPLRGARTRKMAAQSESGSGLFWEQPGADPGDVPQVGGLYDGVPLLSVECGDRGPKFGPISHVDEQGRDRIYLATCRGYGLVMAKFGDESAWLVPLISEQDFAEPAVAREIFESAHARETPGWLYLPPLPRAPGSGFVVPAYYPTLMVAPLLTLLIREAELHPIAVLSRGPLLQLRRSLCDFIELLEQDGQ